MVRFSINLLSGLKVYEKQMFRINNLVKSNSIVKTITNIVLNMTRTTILNFKLFFKNQNYNRNSFYIKALDRLQDNVRFSIFRTYPEFESLSRF